MIRGFTDAEVICPNVEALTVRIGLLNCGGLKALKNSPRNSTDLLSWKILVTLASDMSQLNCPGPRTMPMPELPYPVPPVPAMPAVAPTVGSGPNTTSGWPQAVVPVPVYPGPPFRYPEPGVPGLADKPLMTRWR